ncbi:MAG TPA: hypothetical protein VMP67_03885 [Candidatus Limnocylindria bacterium]|nr:hypothetical protein [Candidatus Limnocylindria bacterium]
MTEPYILWALVVGCAVGAALTWLAIGRLPRQTEDVGPDERMAEAAWISSVVAGRGGQAPAETVEEVLELHEQYLSGPAPDLSPEERAGLATERARRAEEIARAADGRPVPRDSRRR